MKKLAYLLIAVGALCIPTGHALYRVARKAATARFPDGTLAITNPAAGFWAVIAGYASALVLLVAGLIALRRANRSKGADEAGAEA